MPSAAWTGRHASAVRCERYTSSETSSRRSGAGRKTIASCGRKYCPAGKIAPSKTLSAAPCDYWSRPSRTAGGADHGEPDRGAALEGFQVRDAELIEAIPAVEIPRLQATTTMVLG